MEVVFLHDQERRSHCPIATLYWKSKMHSQFLDTWCNFNFKDCTKLLSFFVNPVQVKWRPLKQTKTKIGCHFWRPTFHDYKLCLWAQKDSFILMVLKMEFVCGWAMISNIADLMCDVPYHGSAKNKINF